MPYEYDTSGICIMPADLRIFSCGETISSYDLRASSKLSGSLVTVIADSAFLTIIIFNIWSSSEKIGANTTWRDGSETYSITCIILDYSAY